MVHTSKLPSIYVETQNRNQRQQQAQHRHHGIPASARIDMGINNWQITAHTNYADPMSWSGTSSANNDCDGLSEVNNINFNK